MDFDIKDEIFNRIENGVCEVLGLGISNMPLCRWLCSKGATVIGRDMKPISEIPGADELALLGVKIVSGEGYLEGIGGDQPQKAVIFRAPGIRPDVEGIKKATERGALLTSEMELFLELTPTKVFGITGSDGKTTTTTLVGEILKEQARLDGASHRVYVGGNIGTPLLPLVGEMTENDIAVVELSSFQLMTAKKSPNRALITNITENHLNWHRGMSEYEQAKKNIYANKPCERVVLNFENECTARLAKTADIETDLFSSKRVLEKGAFILDGAIVCADGNGIEKIVALDEIVLPGMHNVENYMAAILLTRGYASAEAVRRVASSFAGVEHRCELFAEKGGIKFYNSSIDSTPTRTAAALSNFKTKPIVICGGRDKNTDFAPLAKTLCEKARAVVLTGEAANKIKIALLAHEGLAESGLVIMERPDFRDAVLAALECAKEGDSVILSPACTSFDAFRNFEERGRKFKEIIKEII